MIPLKTPDLAPRFLAPPGWHWHSLKNKDGKYLRFGTVAPANLPPSVHIILLPGRAEFAEKYFELARDLLQKNCAVWIMEWQGQGLSDRPIPRHPERGHSQDFIHHVNDLHAFITKTVPGDAPRIMLAHSMGANIGLRYLHAHPGIFAAAALTAPLFGIPAVDDIPAAPVILHLLSRLAGKSYAPGQHDWSPGEDDTYCLTSDPSRAAAALAWLTENPPLRVGGVTCGWLDRALASCHLLKDPETLHAIHIPCLIALAGREQLVDNLATRKAITALPHAKILEFPGAGHEILMESDEIRTNFLDAFFSFIPLNP